MPPEEHSPASIEELAGILLERYTRAHGTTASERICAVVAGALRFTLRAPDTARALLLTWQAEQVAGDAFRRAADVRPKNRRTQCIECGRPFGEAPFKGGWCDAGCFTSWSADLPPEPKRRG